MNLIDAFKKAFGITDPVEQPQAFEKNEDLDSGVKPPQSPLPPAREMREEIVRFIIHSLRPYTDEKNNPVTGLRFYIFCENSEAEAVAKVALYHGQPDKFKLDELHRKLANNFILLPANWFFEYNIVRDRLPDCRFKTGLFALDIIDNAKNKGNKLTAKLVSLEGQMSETEYALNPGQKEKYFIGRGKKPVLESGKVQTNDIVFLDKDDAGFDEIKGRSNLFVSRNHAFIVCDVHQRKYFLYADRGGLPGSGNKTKILKASDDRIERVDILGAAHELSDGDQIELGGEARLLFLLD